MVLSVSMNKFGSYALFDPRETLGNRQRFRREMLSALSYANSLYCPSGRYPARGWLLMTRSDYNRISKYSTNLSLQIGDTNDPNNVNPLGHLCIVQAQCATRGLAADPNALYLIEVTDKRGVLSNKWFNFPLMAAYNIRAPAYPQMFYEDSLNSGVEWTWTTMLQNIWETMGTFLGTWPGLPTTPTGTPEGFWFTGVSAWESLNDILDYLGLGIACDLTQNSPYTIINYANTSTAFSALQSRYVTNLEDDLEWIDAGAGRVPGTVKVYFKRRNEVYGNEETVRRDGLQWATESFYERSVSAPSTFSGASGTHFIWSDFTVRYNQEGVPLSADVAVATTIASERVTQFFNRIYNGTLGFMSQTYAGALPFATGPTCDGICWYQSSIPQGNDGGWRTKVVRGVDPPFPIYESKRGN